MQVEVRFRGVTPSGALRDHAFGQARFHLARFGESVAAVVVRVSDENGPKGGVDKRCHVVVRGPAIGSVSLAVEPEDAYAAVDAACLKVAKIVGRELARLSEGRVGELEGAS